jgi:hypothetical protein
MNEQKSPHILNASSNLLGLCFVVLTSLKIMKLSNGTVIDEITAATTILFMSSCILSFMSIRNSFSKGDVLEKIADIIFLTGLGTLFITILLFSFNVIA